MVEVRWGFGLRHLNLVAEVGGVEAWRRRWNCRDWKVEIGKSFCGMSFEGLSNQTPDHMSVLFYKITSIANRLYWVFFQFFYKSNRIAGRLLSFFFQFFKRNSISYGYTRFFFLFFITEMASPGGYTQFFPTLFKRNNTIERLYGVFSNFLQTE